MDLQRDALAAAGCTRVWEEVAGGAKKEIAPNCSTCSGASSGRATLSSCGVWTVSGDR
ncbi:hypothetical protein Pd630_LPD10087 (plasmid) [Rhodococcus opacus PD630]|nr:hypothetical protein Pd630_LPD10087 [Rhodococcus opacus PD630]